MKNKNIQKMFAIIIASLLINTVCYANTTDKNNNATTCDDCVSNALLANQKNFVKLMGDLFQVKNSVIDTIKPQYQNLLEISAVVDKKISTAVSNLVSYYLKDLTIKKDDQTRLTKDALSNKNEYDEVFSNKTESLGNNAVINMNGLLQPKQYTDEEANVAKGIIQTLETLTPLPDIIEIKTEFRVPVEGKDELQTIKLAKKDFNKYINTLNNNSKYIEYKKAYRSAILSRSVLFGNVLRSYEERIPQEQYKGKSIAQLDYDSATWRLNQDYYNKIQDATPVAIQRENLYLLSELRYDLYKLRQQNERMLLLQSILGLQMSNMSDLDKDSKIKQIGKIMYCIHNPEDKDTCEAVKSSNVNTKDMISTDTTPSS